jgi:hypothetical protein
MIGETAEQDNSIFTEDDEENPDIPAGYTYFGQFIDHDITFDPVASFDRLNDPDARHNFRTPRLDLDSLYGRGPEDQPYLYRRDRVRFLLGKQLSQDGAKAHDVPRSDDDQALLGDPRNDENRIVSQLHCLFLRLHNVLVDRLCKDRPYLRDRDLFQESQRLTRYHYQWMVLNDFLPRIVGRHLVDAILGREVVATSSVRACGTRFKPRLLFYRPKMQRAYIPVEFSVAAYRFGHSMVRPSYHFNRSIMERMEKDRQQGKRATHRTPIFSQWRQDSEADLGGFRAMPLTWVFDWSLFFGYSLVSDPFDLVARIPQPSYKIDTHVSGPLIHHLATAEVVTNRPVSLAARNLLRGLQLGLPSGQAIARLMGLEPLRRDQIALSDDERSELRKRLSGGVSEEEIRAILDTPFELADDTPLWFYLLREADVLSAGRMLGPIGGRIVAEILIGILFLDKSAYVNVDPSWHPSIGRSTGGEWQASMADLVQFVESEEGKSGS